MFYLFNSAASARYKTNILDALCYPEGHTFRFRYQNKYVGQEVNNAEWRKSLSIGKLPKGISDTGLIIYAHKNPPASTRHFEFYPIRQVHIIQVTLEGSIYYVDFSFGKFHNHPLPLKVVNPQEGQKQESAKAQEISYQSLLPQSPEDKFFRYDEKGGAYWAQYLIGSPDSNPNQAWENIVQVLGQSPSMNTAIFYLIKGFYVTQRRFWYFGEWQEKEIHPINRKLDTVYPLPMGKEVILKLLFYRSTEAESKTKILPQKLEIKADSDAFAGFSQKEIGVTSRYNEERILIATKRVLDNILSTISIELVSAKKDAGQTIKRGADNTTSSMSSEVEVVSPRPFLLTQVTVPKRVVGLILLGLIFAPLLLSIGPDFLQDVGGSQFIQERAKSIGDWLVRNKLEVSSYCKIAAAIVTLVAGYAGFRKIPLGK